MAAVILAKRRHRQKVATGGTFILLFVIINKSRVFMEKKVFLIVRLPCSAVGSSVSYPSYLLLAEGELHLLLNPG